MKWMKIAGVIGVLFFIVIILANVFAIYKAVNSKTPFINNFAFTLPQNNNIEDSLLIEENSSKKESSGKTAIILAILLLVFVLILLYYYGCYKLGKSTQSSLLTFSSKSMIVILILGVILSIAIVFIIYKNLSNSISILPSSSELNNIEILLHVLLSFLLSFSLINILVFAFGFIDISDAVKHAKKAGFFLIFALGFNIAFIIFSIPTILTTVMSFLIPFSGGINYNLLYISAGIYFLSSILMSLSFLFQALALFDGTKKFESVNSQSAISYLR